MILLLGRERERGAAYWQQLGTLRRRPTDAAAATAAADDDGRALGEAAEKRENRSQRDVFTKREKKKKLLVHLSPPVGGQKTGSGSWQQLAAGYRVTGDSCCFSGEEIGLSVSLLGLR